MNWTRGRPTLTPPHRPHQPSLETGPRAAYAAVVLGFYQISAAMATPANPTHMLEVRSTSTSVEGSITSSAWVGEHADLQTRTDRRALAEGRVQVSSEGERGFQTTCWPSNAAESRGSLLPSASSVLPYVSVAAGCLL